jgi:endonuclease-3
VNGDSEPFWVTGLGKQWFESMTPRNRTILLQRLAELYPDPRSELNFDGEFQLVVAVILSAQCTDKKVNEVTPILFERYPDFSSLGKARLSSIEKIIRPVNYYVTKSKNLIAMARIVEQEFGGKLPRTHGELVTLAGVGNKTANVVLSELRVVPAFPVDTHIKRLANRLGLSAESIPDKVERDLKNQFPPETWRNLHHQLIFHGRRVCGAQRPRCGECSLNAICPSQNRE